MQDTNGGGHAGACWGCGSPEVPNDGEKWDVAGSPHTIRGTSLMRNSLPLGPYSRTLSRALWGPLGRVQFLVSEVFLFRCLLQKARVSLRATPITGDELARGNWPVLNQVLVSAISSRKHCRACAQSYRAHCRGTSPIRNRPPPYTGTSLIRNCPHF